MLHLPTTIWYIVFCYAPMFGVVIAFKNYRARPGRSFLWSLIHNSEWVGFENFQFLFKSSYFETMLRNTLVYNTIFIILGVVIPVALAIMISQLYSKKLAKTCQTMMFLPHFLSWVVIGYFVYAFLATDAGLVNNTAKLLNIGDPKHQWYQDVGFWTWFLVFLNVWKTMGYNMVVYMATISGIDSQMYEAALIDGATVWQLIRYIQLPLCRASIGTSVIASLTSRIAMYEQIALTTSGGPGDDTMSLPIILVKGIMDYRYGYANTVGVVMFIIGLIVLGVVNKLFRMDEANY